MKMAIMNLLHFLKILSCIFSKKRSVYFIWSCKTEDWRVFRHFWAVKIKNQSWGDKFIAACWSQRSKNCICTAWSNWSFKTFIYVYCWLNDIFDQLSFKMSVRVSIPKHSLKRLYILVGIYSGHVSVLIQHWNWTHVNLSWS